MTPKEMKAKWLEALRSGKYKQTVNTLKRKRNDGDFGYCCLGVFAEAVLGEDLRPVPANASEQGEGLVYRKIRSSISSPRLIELGMEMNDERISFSKIADMIEKEWEV